MSNHKKLSVLICSLIKRKEKLYRLLSHLNSQIQFIKSVEILVETDSGQMSIGTKRNLLLQRAQGDYIAFIDDDDLVSDDYISKILNAIRTNPDCCSLQGEITHHGQKDIFIHSLKYDHWFEKDSIYYRCPNHLNTIRRELALQVKFPEKNHGEDKDFSMLIYPLLKTEIEIEGTIYYYLAS